MILEFITTDEKYNNGVALEEYNGIISILRANEAKDGQIYAKWGFPQIKREASKKAIPWKVELGDRDNAIAILQTLLAHLESGSPKPVDDNDPEDIPF